MVRIQSHDITSTLVLLDRDGVLIENIERNGNVLGSARILSEVRFIEGSVEACKTLKKLGIKTAIVTNQPDVSRNIISYQDAFEISDHVKNICEINSMFICPHDDGDNCSCRKPKPGLLKEAISYHNPKQVVMIGDRLTDVIAGNSVSATTVQIYGLKKPAVISTRSSLTPSRPDMMCDTLFTAVSELFLK